LLLRHNPHSSLFYVITGSHAAHLLGGLIALAYFVLRARRAATHRAMAVAALYGHFLAVGLSVPFPAAVEMRPGA
jgi:cytochrome c oxidase subunit 3